VRRGLSLPPDALVIGQIGRFVRQKNHAFLLRVAAEAIWREPRVRVLLLGDGPSRPPIEGQAAALGIGDRVRFAGSRDDVPRLMLGGMDVLLFPSHHEGLGLALLEAQASRLPCVVSEAVPQEVDGLPALIRRLPLDAPVEDWATAVLEAAGHRPLSRARGLQIMRQSPFDIERAVPELLRLYDGAAA
jgi:glycosyltransferase involved in cell wall biosynthesis